jgi:hypothetical protein
MYILEELDAHIQYRSGDLDLMRPSGGVLRRED